MQTLWIECEDGVERPFHAQYTNEWYELTDEQQELMWNDCDDYLESIIDEDGEPIPKKICICAAHSEDECVCEAYTGNYDEYFSNEYKESME